MLASSRFACTHIKRGELKNEVIKQKPDYKKNPSLGRITSWNYVFMLKIHIQKCHPCKKITDDN